MEYRSKIGYAAGDLQLFNISIRQNLLMSCPSASDEDLREALIDAQAWEFVSSLPHGLDTLVDQAGATLS